MRDPVLRSTNGWWNLHFYDPERHPKRKALALGTRRKAEAERAARRILGDIAAGRFDPWLDAKKGTAAAGALTVLGAHERFKAEQEAREARGLISPSTLRDYARTLRGLLERLPETLPLAAVTAEHIDAMTRRAGLSPASERTYRRKLGVFFKWCLQRRLLRVNPMEGMERPAPYAPPPVWLRRDEFQTLLTAIRNDTVRASAKSRGYNGRSPVWIERAVRLAVSTGMRLTELVSLRWSDVDLKSGMIYVRERVGDDGKLVRTKGKRFRVIPIFPATREVLDELAAERTNEDDAATVLVARDGTAVHGPFLSKRFRDMREKAKLSKEIHFHTLRHTFCSWLRLDGVDLDRIREWAGHRTLQQTLAYAHLVPEAVAHEGAPSFPALTATSAPAAPARPRRRRANARRLLPPGAGGAP